MHLCGRQQDTAMSRTRLFALTACFSAAVLTGSTGSPGEAGAAFVRLTPEQMQWQDVPHSFGVQTVTLAGDPHGTGLYVQRVKFPPHVMDRPHFHPHERYVTVLQGTWYAGTGAQFDPQRAVPMKPGSYMLHPAKALHWDGSNGDETVIVQIVGLGPADTVPAEPQQPLWVHLSP
jgi:quercetin dioxygenase-like cupin family protein